MMSPSVGEPGYRPYCGGCSTMLRMVRKDDHFKCSSCGLETRRINGADMFDQTAPSVGEESIAPSISEEDSEAMSQVSRSDGNAGMRRLLALTVAAIALAYILGPLSPIKFLQVNGIYLVAIIPIATLLLTLFRKALNFP